MVAWEIRETRLLGWKRSWHNDVKDNQFVLQEQPRLIQPVKLIDFFTLGKCSVQFCSAQLHEQAVDCDWQEVNGRGRLRAGYRAGLG